jgi:hypothetical protein
MAKTAMGAGSKLPIARSIPGVLPTAESVARKTLTKTEGPQNFMQRFFRPSTEQAGEMAKIAERSQRGLLERGVSRAGKMISPIASGTDKELMHIASNNVDEFRGIMSAANDSPEKGAEAIMQTYGRPARQQIVEPLSAAKKEIGEKLDKVAEAIPEVDIMPLHTELDSFTSKLSNSIQGEWQSGTSNNAMKNIAEDLRDTFFHPTKYSKEAVEAAKADLVKLVKTQQEIRSHSANLQNNLKKMVETRGGRLPSPTEEMRQAELQQQIMQVEKFREKTQKAIHQRYKTFGVEGREIGSTNNIKPLINAETREMQNVGKFLQDVGVLEQALLSAHI